MAWDGGGAFTFLYSLRVAVVGNADSGGGSDSGWNGGGCGVFIVLPIYHPYFAQSILFSAVFFLCIPIFLNLFSFQLSSFSVSFSSPVWS